MRVGSMSISEIRRRRSLSATLHLAVDQVLPLVQEHRTKSALAIAAAKEMGVTLKRPTVSMIGKDLDIPSAWIRQALLGEDR